MNLDTEQLKAQCVEALRKTGENYLSLRMEITARLRDDKSEVDLEFGSYTPNTNHCYKKTSPQAALDDTVTASLDPEKLLAAAAKFQAEADALRARVAKKTEGGK